MEIHSLTLNHQVFDFQTIREKAYLDYKNLSLYEQNTLLFCHEWLNGREDFNLSTSGSTGQPKPIHIKRKQMQMSAAMTAKALNLESGDKSLVCLNTQYIAGIMMLVRGFEIGMQMWITEPKANPFADIKQDISFDFTALVPLQLQQIIKDQHSFKQLNAMKAILVGGATVGKALEEEIQSIEAPVFNTYGMTETLSHIALRRLNGTGKKDYFTVLEGVEISMDDRNCLKIKTPTIPNGEELITNDVVEMIDAQNFRWIGRADNVVNSGGVKIQPEKVEAILEDIFRDLKLPNRFFVAGIPDEKLGWKLILLIEAYKDISVNQATISDCMKQRLTPYEIPKSIHIIPHFLETETSKINKAATIRVNILL